MLENEKWHGAKCKPKDPIHANKSCHCTQITLDDSKMATYNNLFDVHIADPRFRFFSLKTFCRRNTLNLNMDGIEEDSVNLSQMIRDYYEPGSRTINYHSSSEAVEDDYGSKFVSLEEILENVTDAEKEVVGKILLYWRDMEPEKLRKWIVKKLGMDCYEACLCRTSWITNFGRPSALRYRSDYEYIDVMMKNGDDDQPVRLIVDIAFQSQFELARPTQAYQELLNYLPKIFVGTEKKLMKIISVLCSAAKQSLKERNLHVPSWRKASYMQSKWFSIDCKRISFSELDLDHTQADEPTTGRRSSGSCQLSRWTPAVVKHW